MAVAVPAQLSMQAKRVSTGCAASILGMQGRYVASAHAVWQCSSAFQHTARCVAELPCGQDLTFILLCLGLGPQLGSGLVGNLVCRFSLDSLTAPWARLKLALCSGCLASSLPAAKAETDSRFGPCAKVACP